MTAHLPPVLAGFYGHGAVFPVVVLGAAGTWWQPVLTGLPDNNPGTVLALRWSGPDTEEPAAPALLTTAAARAPELPANGPQIARYAQTLPAHIRLVTLTQDVLIGRWDQRPGQGAANINRP
ncbi:hypothetical protein [Actinacidiphila sp. ITFR-21]|uniref:hypothetical protein n=1 Tax=Actinacidiphila sp. ITFR-21 TaxID=3075199 RepID=UPI00288C2BC0|nr:hypothetical protein [Streptomyces sp. ITFR-21]WNI19930.1 hypothetical protein RLT57_30780 [Streptomyces sp. ITFR-21]